MADYSAYEIEIGDTRELVTKLDGFRQAVEDDINGIDSDTDDAIAAQNARIEAFEDAFLTGGTFKGGHDASTGSYPAAPAAGDFWIITVAGTMSSVYYLKGDRIAYTGSAWILTPARPDVSSINPKALSQAIHMTAASSGSNGIKVLDDDDIDLGTGNFTISFIINLSSYSPSVTSLGMKAEASGATGWLLDASGEQIFLRLPNAAQNNWIYFFTPSLTSYAGRSVELTFVVIRETASVAGSGQWYIDGIAAGSAQAITAGQLGTLSSTQPMYFMGGSSNRCVGVIQALRIFNRALSAAEVLDLAKNGIAFADKWGSQTAIYSSDFSAGVDSWINSGGGATLAGNIDGIGGQDNVLRFYAGAGNQAHFARRDSTAPSIGKMCLVTFDYYLPSANTNVDSLRLLEQNLGFITPDLTVTDAWTSVIVPVYKVADLGFRIYMRAGGASTFAGAGSVTDDLAYIKNFKVWQVGATLALEPEGIDASLQWKDSSTNKNHALLPAAGATPVRPVKNWEIRWTNTWAGTHELQYVGGSNQQLFPSGVPIWMDKWLRTISGATIEDIIAGDGSDTNHWIAATTGLAAGKGQFTIATNYDDGTNLKITLDPDANFTGSIASVIRGHILEA